MEEGIVHGLHSTFLFSFASSCLCKCGFGLDEIYQSKDILQNTPDFSYFMFPVPFFDWVLTAACVSSLYLKNKSLTDLSICLIVALIFYGFHALSSGLCYGDMDWAKEALTQFQYIIHNICFSPTADAQ